MLPSPRDTASEKEYRNIDYRKDYLMKVENGVRIMAGTMVLIAVLLTALFSKWWLLLAAFVGINLIQSAFTGFCPAVNILKKLGLEE